jgi:hypothetical protein
MKVCGTPTLYRTQKEKLLLTRFATAICTSRFVKLRNIPIHVREIKVERMFVYKSRADSMSNVTPYSVFCKTA